MGQGPMTGRKMGKCTNFGANLKVQPDSDAKTTQIPDSENFANGGLGRGWGGGRGRAGRGMGRQNRFRGGE